MLVLHLHAGGDGEGHQLIAVLRQWRHTHALFLPADAAAYLGSASSQLLCFAWGLLCQHLT